MKKMMEIKIDKLHGISIDRDGTTYYRYLLHRSPPLPVVKKEVLDQIPVAIHAAHAAHGDLSYAEMAPLYKAKLLGWFSAMLDLDRVKREFMEGREWFTACVTCIDSDICTQQTCVGAEKLKGRPVDEWDEIEGRVNFD